MNIRPEKLGAVTLAASLFLLVHASSARAQAGDGEGGTKRIIIIKGDGQQGEIHLDVNGPANGEGNFIVMAVNNNGQLFTFAGSPAELPFGGSLGPIGLTAMMGNSANPALTLVDPGVSYTHQLIRRPDVRSDLFLDSKQRELLEQMDREDAEAARQRVNAVQKQVKTGDPNAAQEERAKTLHELSQGGTTDKDRKLAAILTPRQIKRLKELDLQYRGPLAMGVKPVAQKTKLTETQAPVVSNLLEKYHEGVRQALGVEQRATRTENPNGSTSVNVNTNISSSSPDEMKAKLEKAHDEIERSRKQLGDKALGVLTDTQRTDWRSLVGVKFQFQTLN